MPIVILFLHVNSAVAFALWKRLQLLEILANKAVPVSKAEAPESIFDLQIVDILLFILL